MRIPPRDSPLARAALRQMRALKRTYTYACGIRRVSARTRARFNRADLDTPRRRSIDRSMVDSIECKPWFMRGEGEGALERVLPLEWFLIRSSL